MRRRQVAGLVAVLAPALASGCGGGASSAPPPPPPPPAEVITITTVTMIQSVQSVPFSVTLQETGAKTAVTWSITAGQLPAGLTLDATTGTISGTPTSQDFEQVVIQARDTGASTTKSFQVNSWAKFILQPIAAAPAHTNVPYNLMLTSNSAITAWSLVGGNFPPGLTFPQGLGGAPSITGTPTTVGSYTFTVQAIDNTVPQTATLDITIVVDSRVTITKSSLAVGGETHVYSDSFTAVNGTPPLHWSAQNAFPPGLSVNATTGAVTGTPTAGGFYSYTVQVTDSSVPAQTDSAQNSISIEFVPHFNFNNSTPAIIGNFYVGFLGLSGGNGQFTITVTSGGLPPGLSISGGEVLGFPTQLGAFTANLQAVDTTSPPYTATTTITIVVVPPPIVMSNMVSSPAPVNALYHSQIGVTGGTPPYSWALASGQLPAGVALDIATGFLDGTPSKTGLYSFQIKATDSSSPPQANYSNYFIEVRPGRVRNDSIATATPLFSFGTSSFVSISPYIDPIDTVTPNPDTDYYKLLAAGGSTVHVETFAQRNNSSLLDTVIELLDQNGQRISTCGSPGFASQCLNDDMNNTTTDSALDFKVPGASTANLTFYLHVLDWRGDARPDMSYSITAGGTISPLVITSVNGFRGTVRGSNFQQGLSTIGQTGNVNWTLDSGALPPGWSLTSTGSLGGVATTDGYYTFVVRATDSSSPPLTATSQYSITVAEPIAITSTATPPNACLNQQYTFAVHTSGGIPTFQFNFVGSSPVGFNFNTGVFSGVPSATGSFSGNLFVFDSGGSSANQALTFNVVTCP